MSFDNDTNRNRVSKMLDILGLIQKSAHSNQTPPEELAEMLVPIMDALFTEPDAEPAPLIGINIPWNTVREMAQKATLKDLTIAMAVYLNRIDEELNP